MDQTLRKKGTKVIEDDHHLKSRVYICSKSQKGWNTEVNPQKILNTVLCESFGNH